MGGILYFLRKKAVFCVLHRDFWTFSKSLQKLLTISEDSDMFNHDRGGTWSLSLSLKTH